MSTKAYGRSWHWAPLGSTAKVVVGLLAACGAIAAIQAVQVATAMSRIAAVTVPLGQFGPQLQNQMGLGPLNGIGSLVTLAAGVSWLIWQHKAQADLYARGLPGLRYTPGWAVAWWFIPVANFVMPYLTMRELWNNAGRGGSGSSTPRGWTVPAWWLVYVASGCVALIVLVLLFEPTFQSIIDRSRVNGSAEITSITLSAASIHAAQRGLIVADALRAVAAGLAMSIVLSISRREDSVGSAGALPPPPPRPDL